MNIEIESIDPEAVGVSSERLVRAKNYAQHVGERLESTGGSVLILRRNKIIGEWYWGTRGPDDERPWDAATMVPVASVSKGLTATALALLIQDGTLWLDEPAHVWIPELLEGDKDKARITVRHLATHSSGLPAGDPDFYGAGKKYQGNEHPYTAFVQSALARRIAFEPGTSHVYSDPAVCLLGELMFRASGKRVPDLLRERIFGPLGLRRIGWDFEDDLVDDIAGLVNIGWNGGDSGTARARSYGAVWGGLITNARDLATFGLLLLCQGELIGLRLIAPLTVRMMTSCQMPMPARIRYPYRGLYWWIKAEPDTPELGHIVPNGTYCHGGAAHSVLVIMPELEIVAVMLRNRLGDPPGFIYDRDYPVFMDLVAAAVDEV